MIIPLSAASDGYLAGSISLFIAVDGYLKSGVVPPGPGATPPPALQKKDDGGRFTDREPAIKEDEKLKLTQMQNEQIFVIISNFLVCLQ